jgi:poly-gamma-glutamate synthesis protein (capsule biosynthesis protein)
MLGRGVAEALEVVRPPALFSEGVVEALQDADLFVLNLECCVSRRGSSWPAPGKPFFFRAPPKALEALLHLGVDCVTLANNHALDFGYEALLDTFDYLDAAAIRWVGAGPDLERARRPVVLEAEGFRLKVVAATDHPRDFSATVDRPGVAYADLQAGVPAWLKEALTAEALESGAPVGIRPETNSPAGAPGARAGTGQRPDAVRAVLLTPHWGPNMTQTPPPYVQRAAAELRADATLIAGHSAHVFQGVQGNVLYDLGDFLDDYALDPVRRNDLGLLFLVTLDATGPLRLEAVPLKLEFCHTRVARGQEADWIRRRFRAACAAFGTSVGEEGGRLVVTMR